MATLRFRALELVNTRQPVALTFPSNKISDYFGQNVFNDAVLKEYLSGHIYKALKERTEAGRKIESEIADAVASGMKSWAISKGATHYTHWFQPLTGATAEKHDAFFDLDDDGKAIEKFKGSALVQQEPDASSFPSGGIRNTFEARGYTAWDPSSPAFIIETNAGKTLCIPTVFVSYTGEALDHKTPLLKALSLIDKAAVAVCEFFDKDITRVIATLGAEQEYFVIDKALFNARPDLVMSGRTVFGHSPAKGQQLEDHYFGSIPARVSSFMQDFETEALKLGIPVRTRHNEVAPGQFECAPTFGEVNLAIDHNQLLMDIMGKVADRHELKVLFHEKPFAGINGSGKHNNWALGTNTGRNLLSPGKRPKDNLLFLTFFINTIKAVHEYADLLRASIASAGNDHRLGANEAPPAIISAFIGSQLTEVLDALEQNTDVIEKGDNMYLKLGIDKIPEILLDNTDRNRTSPFAFTGNKFEFRAVGSSANSAGPMTVLNTIVANQLLAFKAEADKEIEAGGKKEVVIINILKRLITESKAVRFEGNGYSDEWVEEAAKRGLNNIKTTPLSLDAYVTEHNKNVFIKNGIFSDRELEARHEIYLEEYIKKVQIESRLMGDLAQNHVVPTAITYQNKLIANVKGLKEIGLGEEVYGTTLKTILEISSHLSDILKNVFEMTEARKRANNLEHSRDKAIAYCDDVKEYFEVIRHAVDKLELLVDDEDWPLPKYRELLFLK
ncbi:MAG: glutamine synthetase III [Bacteroidota bacterium]